MRAGISFPYLFPLSLWSPLGAYHPLFPSPQSAFFFRRFPRCASCNPATPIVAHESGGEGNQARREQGGRRAGCYICNVFAFTIFQLVCILEPLLLASTLVPSIFSPSSRLPLRYARTTTGECCTLRLSRLLDHRPRGAIVLSAFPCA